MNNKNFLLSALKSGSVLAGIYMIYSMLVYVLDINIFSIAFSIGSFLFTVLLIAIVQTVGGRYFRDTFLNGDINYGQAFLFLVVIGAFSSIFIAIYDFIYSSAVDMAYLQPKIDVFMTKLEEMGVPEDKLQETYDKMQKAITMPAYKRALNSLGSMLIFNAVIALIVSIFVKKNKEVAEVDEF